MGFRTPNNALSFIEWVQRGLPTDGTLSRVHLASCSGDACDRTLQAAQDCPAGSVLASVPWALALSTESALERLRGLEKVGAGLLPQGISSLTALLSETADKELLPPACAWVLLLALHLLCELRDPRSRWARYVGLLPTPPGSRVAAVCSEGPPASDLLLFSAEELGQLQNTELAASVEKERLRLARLHSRHFRQPGPGSSGREPVVSLEAFVWAHCLVRSRALDLTADQGVFHERCMLPLIDMCNHDSNDTTCSLRVRLSPSGEPRSVDLVAARDVIVGENLTLNYGGRPMRDLLRGYGFTPACAAMTDPSEVYENLGDGCQALIVQGSGKGRMFRLAEVRILPERGAYPLLELTNAATLCYEVRDDVSCLPDQARGPVCVAFPAHAAPGILNRQQQAADQGSRAAAAPQDSRIQENGGSAEPKSPAGSTAQGTHAVCKRITTGKDSRIGDDPGRHGDASGVDSCARSENRGDSAEQEPGQAAGAADVSYREGEDSSALDECTTDTPNRQGMQPETERATLQYLAAECRALLDRMPTDADQDEALLQSMHSAAPFSAGRQEDPSRPDETPGAGNGELHGRGCSDGGRVGGSGVDCGGGQGWRQRRHTEMALQYRLQRKLLLARVADDLAAQAALLG